MYLSRNLLSITPFVAVAILNCNAALAEESELSTVASSKSQWTGVAVAKDRRVFANFPRWSDAVTTSVVQVLKDGSTLPYPDQNWNEWKGENPKEHFVCVQAVYADHDNNLWIVDPGAPKHESVVHGAPKLVKIDLKTNIVDRVYRFDDAGAPQHSYLNDVRIDAKRNRAYLTDSGLGAIVVVDLETGKVMRRLSEHPSTKAEDIKVVVEGKEFGKQPDGSYRKVNSDGIALDSKGEYLYYQALTGKNLYRVPVKDLVSDKVSDVELGKKVEHVAETCPADAIEFGTDRKLYITSIEDSSVKRLTVGKKVGKLEVAVRDKQLSWPDSLANGSKGVMFVTSSQITLGPSPSTPYKIFKFKIADSETPQK